MIQVLKLTTSLLIYKVCILCGVALKSLPQELSGQLVI